MKGILSESYPFMMEESLLTYLEDKGLTKKTVKESILHNSQDRFSAYYFILLKEKL